MANEHLKNLHEDDLKSRLEDIKNKYKSLADDIAPKLKTLVNLEKEMNLLVEELKSRA